MSANIHMQHATIADRVVSDTSPYPEVRALERGLALIDALGEYGWLGPTELAKYTGVDRATIYRLLSTLVRTGFVVHRPQDSKYFLASKFRQLSMGIREQDSRVLAVAAPLRELVEDIRWPSDFAVLMAGRLVIVDSSHTLTTMSCYRSVVGHSRPILRSALGRAMLSAMSDEERAEAIETILLAGGADANEIGVRAQVDAIVESTRRRGFAVSEGAIADNISAIALPVIVKGRVVGAINVIFFRSSFNIEKIGRYIESLRKCVSQVESAFTLIG
ncbi:MULTISPECIES: helix-turn-helix domain-containing protein [unclassified Pseudomonas]|uniref:IclR family transcriptional regulator domain-containing protein n=1 Tax=unclassified Pseudomonas TaxID=196821 RepID=UPI0008715EEF|nr:MULTISPECIES: helix-turn-helix domain-containing protein [unclassified Pseudomonas]SCW56972.1 transcriptional regulator, IclR family [Pseudomonas sp. NFACC56-3]SFK30772.1 transcriptional regulator, IclR family [Pseudomonas sp. NFACC52]